MLYRTQLRKIDEAFSKVVKAAVDAGHAQATVDEATTALHGRQQTHREQLRAFKATVEKFAEERGRLRGQLEGRKSLLQEQQRERDEKKSKPTLSELRKPKGKRRATR